MSDGGFWLASQGLLSRWGFNDGDPYLDGGFEDWRDAHGLPLLTGAEEDWLLRHLVRTWLVPALDQVVEVVDIETSHNPIRASKVDGVDVDGCWSYPYDQSWPGLTPEAVFVTFEDAQAALDGRPSDG